MKAKKKPERLPETPEVLMEIGARLRKHRKSITNNYEDFAADHGLSKVTISRLEQGENFTMETLIKVLRILNIEIEDFFKGIR